MGFTETKESEWVKNILDQHAKGYSDVKKWIEDQS